MNIKPSEVLESKTFSIELVKNKIKEMLLNKNGNIKGSFCKNSFIENRNIIELFQNILFYTRFLNIDDDWKIRIHCILFNLSDYPTCPNCGKKVFKYSKNDFRIGFNRYCSFSCRKKQVAHPFTFMSKEDYDNFRERQSKVRKGSKLTDEWIDKLKKSASKESVKKKKRETCLDRYGLENPGVLGAYYSKNSIIFIEKYFKDNNINPNKCYYKNGGVNKKEFFQIIGKKYVSYDLVIFSDEKSALEKDLSKIERVIEYNGPWHYLEEELDVIGDTPATPYSTNSKTVRETYEFDLMKKEHMLQYTKEYEIYWEAEPLIRRLGYEPEGIRKVWAYHL